MEILSDTTNGMQTVSYIVSPKRVDIKYYFFRFVKSSHLSLKGICFKLYNSEAVRSLYAVDADSYFRQFSIANEEPAFNNNGFRIDLVNEFFKDSSFGLDEVDFYFVVNNYKYIVHIFDFNSLNEFQSVDIECINGRIQKDIKELLEYYFELDEKYFTGEIIYA